MKHLEGKMLHMNEVSSLKGKKEERMKKIAFLRFCSLIAFLNFAYLMTVNLSKVCPFLSPEVVLYFF